jgi:hypothetical protein
MPSWSDRQGLIATLAFAFRQSRPLLRRIVAEKHPSPTELLDPAMMAAEKILRQLELSNYEVRRKDQRQRPHHTP